MVRVPVCVLVIAVVAVWWPAAPVVAYAEPDPSQMFHTPRSLMLSALDVIENEYVDPVAPVRLLNAALGGIMVTTHLTLPALPATLLEPQARERALGAVAWAAAQAGRTLDEVDEAATAAMVASLHDSHTVFLSSQRAQEVKLALTGMASYGGIGIRTTVLADVGGISWPYVTDLVPQGPAEAAGIRKFDRIVGIDGTPTANLTPAQLETKLRGRGVVDLGIVRRGRPMVLTVSRRQMAIPGATITVLPGGIASARFFVLRHDGVALFEGVLSRLERQRRLRGTLIDLRDIPGGEDAAILEVLQLFLPIGTPVFQARGSFDGTRLTTVRSNVAPAFPVLPVAVLMNHRTASAGEVVAAALHDAHRAVLVGERTSGNVGGAIFQWLPRRTAMFVTVERLIGALGEPLEGAGVQPDLQVSLTAADLDHGLDSQVAAAVEWLCGRAGP